jgi:hypothetical protein
MCFLWGTNSIYLYYVEESRSPLWFSRQSYWLQNGDILCFLCGTNSIYLRYVDESRPPLWSSCQSSWLQNGDILCFPWSTNWICCVEESRPPLWFSGQSSWLHIQRTEFDSQHYHIFWEVVGLKRDPLSLVGSIEELLGRKGSCCGLENNEYGCRDPSGWPRGTLYPQKLALSSPTSGGRSVGIVHSRTQATEISVPLTYALLSCLLYKMLLWIHGYRVSLCLASCYTLLSCSADIRQWMCSWHVSSKRRFTYGLHRAVFQKMATFINTAVRTSNHTNLCYLPSWYLIMICFKFYGWPTLE